MNILNAAEPNAEIDSSSVKFESERCLNTISNLADCNLCADLCPSDAIHLETQPTLSKSACTNCLACIPACPTGAYQAKDTVLALLKCAIKFGSSTLELICLENPQSDIGPVKSNVAIRVRGCLASLGVSTYLSLAVTGKSEIILRTEFCNDCPMVLLKSHIKQQVKIALSMLNAQADFTITLHDNPDSKKLSSNRPLWDIENPPLSRRDLFRFISPSDQLSTANTLTTKVEVQGKSPGPEMLRKNDALNKLFADEFINRTQSLEDLNYALVRVSSDCTACGVCARACPTSALELQKQENHFKLVFSAQKCIGCGICQKICVPKTITILQNPAAEEVFGKKKYVTLIEGELKHCIKCGVGFVTKTNESYCTICAYRVKNPFGSKMPPSYQSEEKTDHPDVAYANRDK